MSTAGVVAGIGAVAADLFLSIDGPLAGGKARVLRQERSYGGNIATALGAAVSLGGTAWFLGALPDRVTWAGLHEDLERLGVDVSSADVVDGGDPIRSTILVAPDGDRFIAFDARAAAGATPRLDVDALARSDVLLIDGYAPVEGLRAIGAARRADVPVVADLEFIDDGVQEVQDAVDHLVVPIALAREVTGATAPEDAVAALWHGGRQAVVVTDGHNGSWYRCAADSGVVHEPALAVDVVDTTGCGDVFHGAYALHIGRGRDVPFAVAQATAAAAVCATGFGGRGHLPTETSVSALMTRRTSLSDTPDEPGTL